MTAALQNDPDLVHIKPRELPHVLQRLFVCSGSDNIHVYIHIWLRQHIIFQPDRKDYLPTVLFRACQLHTGKDTPDKGTLADIDIRDDPYQKGFLVFLKHLVPYTLRSMQQVLKLPHLLATF